MPIYLVKFNLVNVLDNILSILKANIVPADGLGIRENDFPLGGISKRKFIDHFSPSD